MENIFNMNRLNRLPFFLANWACGIASNVASDYLTGATSIGLVAFTSVLSLLLIAKRLHDIDLSAWWILAFAGIVFAGGFCIGFAPETWGKGVGGLLLFAGAIGYLYLLFAPGTKGNNRFGSDPLAQMRMADFAE